MRTIERQNRRLTSATDLLLLARMERQVLPTATPDVRCLE